MFLEIEEMKTVAAEYKLEEITDYDDTIERGSGCQTTGEVCQFR